jgi:hypothetical protein
MTNLIPQLLKYFKENYGFKINDSSDLFVTEKNMLEYVMGIGRNLMNKIFEEMGSGYEGRRIERDGKEYEFKGNRSKSIHGLFGSIDYKRAYYVGTGDVEGSCIPLDEKIGIRKKHTPGFNYFFSTFSGREAYQESLDRFHEIFRPEGKELISLRKALDMDYELGGRVEGIRQEEIKGVYEEGEEIEKEEVIGGVMAVSIDATKVREKLGEEVIKGGKKRYEIGFKDVKIAGVSEIVYDKKQKEAKCKKTSYVSGIEHADDFFKRVWVEMTRRSEDISKERIVFIGDGAPWIWDRVIDMANKESIQILDYYHGCEHVSDICKEMYVEGTELYWEYFRKWKELIYEGKVEKVIDKLKKIREKSRNESIRELIQKEINYFEVNKDRMRYDKYRKMKLPIGSGTIESACKNVIGGRLKQGGMTWSPLGAKGMLQIRSSIKSGRFYKDFKRTLQNAA